MHLRTLRTAAALALASLPLPALATLTSPADVLGAIENDNRPHAFTMEIHAGADGTYVSVWGKGTHQGTIPALAAGQGTVTVDVVDHAQGIDARIRLLYRLTGGTLYVSIGEARGAFVDDLAAIDLRLQGKKWIMLPLTQELQTLDRASSLTILADMLRSSGIEVDEGQIDAFMDVLANAAFSLKRSVVPGGANYVLTLQPSFVDEALRAGTAFMMRTQGADPRELRQALQDVLRDNNVAMLRGLLASLRINLAVRTGGDVPTAWTLAGDWTTDDVRMSIKASSQLLTSLPAVAAPMDALLPEEFFAALRSLWPMADAVPAMSFLHAPMMDFPDAESMPPPSVWPDEEESMDASCVPSTISGVNDLRKGQLCGRFTRIRRHLDQ